MLLLLLVVVEVVAEVTAKFSSSVCLARPPTSPPESHLHLPISNSISPALHEGRLIERYGEGNCSATQGTMMAWQAEEED